MLQNKTIHNFGSEKHRIENAENQHYLQQQKCCPVNEWIFLSDQVKYHILYNLTGIKLNLNWTKSNLNWTKLNLNYFKLNLDWIKLNLNWIELNLNWIKVNRNSIQLKIMSIELKWNLIKLNLDPMKLNLNWSALINWNYWEVQTLRLTHLPGPVFIKCASVDPVVL